MKKRMIRLLATVMLLLSMATLSAFADTNAASEANILLVKSSTVKETAVELEWNAIPDATKYVVYGNSCGNEYKKIATVSKCNYVVKKIKGKKLQARKTYKFYVAAYNNGKRIAKSKSIHCITAGTAGKYGNVKSIKTAVTELNLQKGDTFRIKVTKTIKSGKKHLPKSHGAATRYYSTDKTVVEIDKTGLIKTKRDGRATIYAQDIGGKYVAINLVVAGRAVGALTAGSSSSAGPLCFTLDDGTLNNQGKITMEKLGKDESAVLLYSFNGRAWEPFTFEETEVPINRSHPTVYFKAAQPNKIVGGTFVITAKSVYASGNVMTLLDPTGESVTIEEESAFGALFYGCTALKSAPKLPAVNLSTYCYRQMFCGCTGLDTMPVLPATKLADFCYLSMFANCGFINGVELPATELAGCCYSYMFEGCDGVSFANDSGEVLPARNLADGCYMYMFAECDRVINGPKSLPATALPGNCYRGMYMGCPDVVTTPQMTITSIDKSSCEAMFQNCSNLKNANNIRMGVMMGIGMAESSCKAMFKDCSNLTGAPGITIAVTAMSCCEDMYKNCTKLVTVAHSMGMTTAEACYRGMFIGCTNLKNTPTLGARTLAKDCYSDMYHGCSALTSAAPMEATQLADGCCERMYMDCVSMTSAPELKAEMLVHDCYANMFNGCTKLTSLRVRFHGQERSFLYCAGGWLNNASNSGTIYCPSDMSDEYIPAGWTRRNI